MKVRVTLVAGVSIFEVVVNAADYEAANRAAKAQNADASVAMASPV